MPATWTAEKTWSVGELVTAALINTHLRDKVEYLKTPALANSGGINLGADITGTSTSFAALDTTNLRVALPSTFPGGGILVVLNATIINSVPTTVLFDVAVDGSRHGGDDGLFGVSPSSATARFPVSFVRYIPGLTSGAHNIDLYYKNVAASTTTLYAGAGTANGDLHPQFCALPYGA